jgi:arsenite methyltransferase
MTLPATVAADPARPDAPLNQALKRRLDKLARVFDFDSVRRDSLPTPAVVQYFEDCHDAYRKYHSREGAVHMALNEGGRFDPDGYLGQPRRLAADWQTRRPPPRRVLELAFGQGFNLAWLAKHMPDTHFAGIDITPAHLRIARERVRRAGLANIDLQEGDLHELPWPDGHFDAVFCVEAFCYASDLPRALGEVHRVLAPGGRFTLFDGYLMRPMAQMEPAGALACELVARGMALPSLQVLDELLSTAQGCGLQAGAPLPLDAEVMPTLERLEKVTGAIIRWPWLGRRMLARRSAHRGRNVLAGTLMATVTRLGLLGYREIHLDKVPG